MTSLERRAMPGETDAIQSAIVPRQELRADTRPVILIAQRSEALGDAILRIPAYRAIRCAFPSHRVVSVYRGRTVFSTVFASLRPLFMDEILEFQGKNGRMHVGNAARSLGNVDAIIDFNSTLQTVVNYVASAGSAPRYVANVVGLALRRGVPWGLEPRPLRNSHRYHRLVELVAGRTLPFDTHLPILPRADLQIDTLLPRGQRYLGIVPGRPISAKYWPLDRHIALAAHIRRMGLRPIYMLGPYPDELSQREALQQANPDAIFIDLDTAGGDAQYLPWLFHAAATRLTACVGVDGGVCHMVATQDIPLATMTGPIGARYWDPVTPQFWNIDARHFGSRAMDAIPVDAVADVIMEMLTWSDRREAQGLNRR